MSTLEAQPLGDDELDPFLALLLGAQARLARGVALLERRADPPAGAAAAAAGRADTLVLAALGWISLQRRLAEQLARVAPPTGATSDATPARRRSQRTTLLR